MKDYGFQKDCAFLYCDVINDKDYDYYEDVNNNFKKVDLFNSIKTMRINIQTKAFNKDFYGYATNKEIWSFLDFILFPKHIWRQKTKQILVALTNYAEEE